MELTKSQLETVIKTLPIGYYLKHGIKVVVNETANCSFINAMNDQIDISVTQLNKVFAQYNSDVSNEIIENDIRCMLYHEISHAILTPLKMTMTDIVNIFEDERIETVFKNFYMRVDFKSFVKKVNQYKEHQKPTSAIQSFYFLVRYRIGKPEFLKRVKDIIKKYATLNVHSNWSEYEPYVREIVWLYEDMALDFTTHQTKVKTKQDNKNVITSIQTQNSNSEDNKSIEQHQDNEIEDVKEEINCDEFDDYEDDEIDDEFDDYEDDDIELDTATLDNALTSALSVFNKYVDNNLKEALRQIILQIKSNEKRNGSAINAYSGKFDVRSVARQDYKYFIQQNRQGNVKQFSKVHLNLFIDCSGSFSGSELLVNKLLYSLKILEKQCSDFSFDLVTLGVGQTIMKKNERELCCRGCNRLTSDIFEQYKKLQLPSQTNINIVLFDGNAFSDMWGAVTEDYKRNFEAFNHSNVSIISDRENETYIAKYCKNAKQIITNNYTAELIKNVMNCLQASLR